MPVLDIVQLGHPVLREACTSVADIAASEVQALVDDMLATMHAVNGLGLAAPQVDRALRLFVFESRPSPLFPDAPILPPTAVFNPEVVWASDETEGDWEGCLSIPGVRVKVSRPQRIRVRYVDRWGRTVERDLAGVAARVFLHEADHLDGIVHFDRMASSRDIVMATELSRARAA